MVSGSFPIVVVDDEAPLRDALARFLAGTRGFTVETAGDGEEALDVIAKSNARLVLTDISMPGLSGIELLAEVKRSFPDVDVIMITGYHDITYAIEAMRRGAYDFFTKPFNFEKVALTVERVRENQKLRAKARECAVLEREQELALETTLSLARAAEERDRENIGHGKRSASWAVKVGERLCYTQERLRQLRFAALLHDIGKIGIDDAILNKRGPLTEEEHKIVRRHSEIGEYILKPVSILRDVAPIVRSHHEHWDGGGYPDGISGDAIPLDARILCLVDYFDAITSVRPYRNPLSLDEAIGLVRSESGQVFDPALVDVFVELLELAQIEITF